MKNISTAFIAILSLYSSSIFGQELPKDGAILIMREKSFDLKLGQKISTSIDLVKSKRYKKAKFGGLTARAPEGITINFEKSAENDNQYLMTLSANDSATKESYMIIIKGKGNNAHKLRGTTIKLNVDQNQMVTANQ